MTVAAGLAPRAFAQNLVAAEEAVAADSRIDSLIAEGAWFNNHEVRLEIDESLPGTAYRFDDAGNLVPAAGVPVHFMQNGKLAGQRKLTDPQGDFQAPVAPGVYTVILGDLTDRYGFACTSIRVLPNATEAPADLPLQTISQTEEVEADAAQAPAAAPAAPPLPAPVAPPVAVPPAGAVAPLLAPKRLEVALIHRSDLPVMRALIARRFSRTAEAAPAAAAWLGRPERSLASLVADVPETPRQAVRFADAAHVFRVDARRGVVPYDGPWHYKHEVFLGNENGLKGHLRTFNADGQLIPVAFAELDFVQRGVTVRSLETSAEGEYAVTHLSSGVYSVMAANAQGFGCYGIKLTALNGRQLELPEPLAKVRQISLSTRHTQPGDAPDLNTTLGLGADVAGFLGAFGPSTDTGTTSLTDAATGGGGGGSDLGALAGLAAAAGLMASQQQDGAAQH
jgi:hypothetical protein